MSGPFESEAQARKAAHQVVSPEPGWSILRGPQNRLLLERTCEAAGVALGAFDRRILAWLSGFEDATCAVIAGLVTRAAAGAGDVPRCAQCSGPAVQYPDPYMPRMLWRHALPEGLATVAAFLDAEHEAAPAGAL